MKTVPCPIFLLVVAFPVISSFADKNHSTRLQNADRWHGSTPLLDAVVIIKAGRLTAVGIGSTLKTPEGATILDGGKRRFFPASSTHTCTAPTT
jgi:hypothetical protein